jgi:hypothetical protein
MLAEEGRRRLLAAVVEIYARAGGGEDGPPTDGIEVPPAIGPGLGLNEAQEEAVKDVVAALTRILALVRSRNPDPELPGNILVAALGGAEMVMRSEIIVGREDWLPRLLPSFTYLTTLPILDRDEALGLAAETEKVVDEFGSGPV